MKKERRVRLYPWRDIEHLKSVYSKYISLDDIDTIITLVKKIGLFKERVGVSKEENECCLCNLIDDVIMNFLRKKRS